MLVMKFGGASVKDADSIRNVCKIIQQFQEEPSLIVISASGKTTNHLETLADLARNGREEETLKQFHAIFDFHKGLVTDLFGENPSEVLHKVESWFKEVKRIVDGILLLEEFPERTYDRIVSYGEILSTTIVTEFLKTRNKGSQWLDARKVIKTDASHKQANVIWSRTHSNIQENVLPVLGTGKSVITQGFIGSTIADKTTTLGREGSDYTASIFAHCLDAEKLMVWKDVPGILNADPRLREDTIKIDNLSYEEAVEMTFYGASVIHPKTIKPLYSKRIPLYVKCFLDTSLPGTCISDKTNADIITSYIKKKQQAFLQIQPKDFSFMDERQLEVIFDHVYKTGVKVNLVQNSAISLLLCVDEVPRSLKAFESLLLDQFNVEIERDLFLHTIIHFTPKDLRTAEDGLMVQQQDNKLFVVKRS
ncbi:MAG: aspartate kinase [Bacteroidota bacterium]